MTFQDILTYVLYALIAGFALGSIILGALLFLSSRRNKEAQSKVAVSKEETLAGKISEEYREYDKPAVVFGDFGEGGSSPVQKKTRSVFSFSNVDEEKINLNSSSTGEDGEQDIILDDKN